MSKYGNKRAVASDGKVFSSKRECKRYEELLLLRKMRKITDLETQVKYQLLPAQKINGFTERAVTYTADFRYYDRNALRWVVEDAKGAKTQQYILRRKMMLYFHGIKIEEI